ncbi:MAG: hypothetical protein AAFU77_00235 [Myxococcota bacterium]
MNARYQTLRLSHGGPIATGEHRVSRGVLWCVEDRILVLYAEGRASLEGARWATEEMSRAIEMRAQLHNRRLMIGWSFENIEGYGPQVGMHFVQWFADERQRLSRFMVYTRNPVLRMTARAATVALPKSVASFPASAEDFDRTLKGWADYIRSHRN